MRPLHNKLGDKPPKTGPPLNERGLSTDEIARAVNGRLRDKAGKNDAQNRCPFLCSTCPRDESQEIAWLSRSSAQANLIGGACAAQRDRL